MKHANGFYVGIVTRRQVKIDTARRWQLWRSSGRDARRSIHCSTSVPSSSDNANSTNKANMRLHRSVSEPIRSGILICGSSLVVLSALVNNTARWCMKLAAC